MHKDTGKLLRRFYFEALTTLGAAYMENAAKWWDVIEEAHEADFRHYHDMYHVKDMLEDIDLVCTNTDWGSTHAMTNIDFEFVCLLTYFLYIEYHPRRGDHFSRSAELFLEFAQSVGLPARWRSLGTVVIRGGGEHRSNHKLAQILYEADMVHISTAEYGIYQTYAAAVREEYSFLNDQEWKVERIKFLQSLLAIHPLFTHEMWGESQTRHAQYNMGYELTILGIPPKDVADQVIDAQVIEA